MIKPVSLSKTSIILRLLILTAVILITEYVTMFFLHASYKNLSVLFGVIGSIVLVGVLVPVLYLVIFRPVNQKIMEARTATDENYVVLAELDQIFNTVSSPMRVVDTEYNITRVNQAFLDLVGLTKDECVGHKCYDIFSGPVCHTPGCTIRKVIEGDTRVEYEITKQCPNGKSIPCIVVAAPFKATDGKITGIVEDYRDITRHKLVEEKMRYQATHDPLTGLANRMFFNDQLPRAIMKMHRSRQKLCVIFLDLNKFKQVNDCYGHSIGDKLLIEAAMRITSCVRKKDLSARLGGDEFILMMPQISGREDAMKIASKISNVFENPFEIDGQSISVRISIGIAIYPDDGEDAKTLMKHADWAMYRSKATGNRFEFYQLENPDSRPNVIAIH